MDLASIYYLGVTILLFLIFAFIVARTYSAKRKESGEAPKYRMMEDDHPIREKTPAGERNDSGRESGSGKREGVGPEGAGSEKKDAGSGSEDAGSNRNGGAAVRNGEHPKTAGEGGNRHGRSR